MQFIIYRTPPTIRSLTPLKDELLASKLLMEKASRRHMEVEVDQELQLDVAKVGISFQQEIVEHE